MNWSRAKTILIALLLAVDVFLLVVYISRDNGVRRDEIALRADVCDILSAQGIDVARELVPLDSVGIRPAVLQRKTDTQKTAVSFFGKVTEEKNEENITYSGQGGSVMFSDDAFSLVYESGKSVDNEDEAKVLAKAVAESFAVTGGMSDYISRSDESGYSIGISQMFSGVPVFDCGIEVKISKSGSVIASGKFIGKGVRVPTDGEVMKTSALMLSFADGAVKEALCPLMVSSVTLGYISKAPAAGRVSMSPTLCVTTDKGVFYVDMQSGKFVSA